jgi:hypothetical protein
MFFTLFVWGQPFATLSNEQVCARLEAGGCCDPPKSCPKHVYDKLIKPCYAENPTERPSFDVLLSVLEVLLLANRSSGTALTAPNSHFEINPEMSIADHFSDGPQTDADFYSPFKSAVCLRLCFCSYF